MMGCKKCVARLKIYSLHFLCLTAQNVDRKNANNPAGVVHKVRRSFLPHAVHRVIHILKPCELSHSNIECCILLIITILCINLMILGQCCTSTACFLSHTDECRNVALPHLNEDTVF
jgi:hypothetical protein